ncbi:M15 family metallopeptidase [Variovorax sp. J22R133]|uniref:M15 family metallopeptidase n=1 Tax=Variovorax brevis TaxID=3053503 RepID=UPI002575777F|nr:M15 family metallopeptidase [Variovorax sp. J22R133]MDM0114745.1 M15 family metallopeptidase [Variovorax sp. J22R133]
MSTTPPTATLTLESLLAQPGIILQRGDNDARSRWGGKDRASPGGKPVRELQEALVQIGAMSATPDGDFGKKTQEAVKRFQWYLRRIAHRLRISGTGDSLHGSIEAYTAPSGVLLDGFVRLTTLAEVVSWRDGGFELASPLVAYSVGKLSNIVRSSTFEVLDYPSAGADEILVHQDFVPWLESMNTKAKDNKVTLRVNQAFRVQGLPVSGAVVPPASSSQHLIGHALDVNIVDGSTVNTSPMFNAGTATQAAQDLVKAAKDIGLRWGGDFSPKDPPHFDKRVLHTSDEYLNSFYFAQRSYDRHHPLRRA